jgi:hypothetical protein
MSEITLESLAAEVKELTVDIHNLQRQQSSRRGAEGARGIQGIPGERGPVGPSGTVSKEQAQAMFREIVNEPESQKKLIQAIVEAVIERITKACTA